MAEFYTLAFSGKGLVFTAAPEALPDWLVNIGFDPGKAGPGITLECRIGDPDLLHCAVFRKDQFAGGFFSLFMDKVFLFAAKAVDNLTFAEALGHFGKICANTRYGVDIFENMEIPDD